MKKGSVFGGMLLIAGSCIGVGMLGLPILTGIAGFIPTLVMLFLAFGFMTTTALYLIEVGSWFSHESNLSTIIQKTLGTFWKSLSWMLYLFLFYSLLVAYISSSGIHLSSLLNGFFGWNIPTWSGSLTFVIIFGWMVFLGTYFVDHLNRYLMFGKIVAFCVMILAGIQYVKVSNLQTMMPAYAAFSLPILVISFGFHNMIPSLNHYLGGNTKRVKKAIIGGAVLTLVIYLIWECVTIGILPIQGDLGIIESFKKGIDGAQAIKNFVHSPTLGIASQSLALFAILTSFLAQTLSLVHFLADGMKRSHQKDSLLCFLALIPPLLCAVAYPEIFYSALNFAGGVCAVILFGIIPAFMVYQGRFKKGLSHSKGFISLLSVTAFALIILINQLLNMLGFNFLPHP